jgi:hypothetical protein
MASRSDPRPRAQKMQERLEDTMNRLREEVELAEEPQLKAMLETSAEVLGGLAKAFHDYQEKTEAAWR